MNINAQPQLTSYPSYAQVIWLRTSFYSWLGLTLIWLILAISAVGLGWESSLTVVDCIRWTVWFVLISFYWISRLKGAQPNKNQPFIFANGLNWSARQIIWQAIGLTRGRPLTNQDILRVLGKQRPVVLAMMRLNVTRAEWQLVLEQAATEAVEAVLVQAVAYAQDDGTQISWAHLLKSIMSVSPSCQAILTNKKITLTEALGVIDWTRKQWDFRQPTLHSGLLHDLFSPKRNLNKTWTAKATPILDRFSRNLSELARVGLLISAKVRGKEVEEVIQVLSKSQGNSVILVGEPGVGKTSVAGDVALRMLRGDIPSLDDYKLIELDIGAMIGAAGNNFQQLFSRAIQEASGSGNTILFIGNLDQLGKAKSGEGFDLSAILLDALRSNNLQLIGTSDPLNYKKYIENNTNLATLFTRVNIAELTPDAAVLVLEDLSRQIESRQGVLMTLAAIKQAVSLSQQYIHDNQLPDKAEDILDEAAVYVARRGLRVVTDKEVGIVMSSKTNIPIGDISQDERIKLAGLEAKIHERLIGQTAAVTAVAQALKRARLGVAASGKRPMGTFLFLGPTGVGKTELARSLAWAYFGDDTKMIRLDMGEYQTKESVHNLIGAPLVTGDIALAGGSFSEAVKKMPFAVILIDEIEKAHPDVLNIFLRVLDEGKLTDNLGNLIDFTHTIIIATSNAEARYIEEAVRQQLAYPEIQKQLTQLLTQQVFKPEFINRFDGVIVFEPLTMAQIEQIATLKIQQLSARLQAEKSIILQVAPAAITALAKKGYDPAFGARPLERVIREVIETKVANSLLNNPETKQVVIDITDILS
ncbi:MAG: ATP-dependent Clp protease ATP-binding subunit [Patescibacteria group bacterium]|jgi:ATP-dependent Clp protease ATP-binding subunit ClpC